MNENLVGYLLNALDPQTQRETEDFLRMHPEARGQLELLRRALEPLTTDREMEPPPGLRYRTYAQIAEYRCRNQPIPLRAPPVRSGSPARSWWHRADVLVAASILVLALGLLPPTLSYLRQQRDIASCQNNLKVFYTALIDYSDRHGRQLPRVEAAPPRDVAGIFVPILRDAGLDSGLSVRCPASGMPTPTPVSLEQLEVEHRDQPAQFQQDVNQLAGCYAYTLGYRQNGVHFGQRADDPDASGLAIMADRPPYEQIRNCAGVLEQNSLNHDGKGQNVLYLDGHVRFCTNPRVGVDRDHIYVNQNQLIKAGLHRLDTVLGASSFHAYPAFDPDN